jgi:hypothetical protein
MRIYFAGSVRGGSWNRGNYVSIVECLKGFGEVLTEHLAFTDSMDISEFSDGEIFEMDVAWLRSADAMIAEVSNPSLGVGYEIAKAEEYGVPVLCLYQEREGRRLSAMVEGNPHCVIRRYKDMEEAKGLISAFITSLESRSC